MVGAVLPTHHHLTAGETGSIHYGLPSVFLCLPDTAIHLLYYIESASPLSYCQTTRLRLCLPDCSLSLATTTQSPVTPEIYSSASDEHDPVPCRAGPGYWRPTGMDTKAREETKSPHPFSSPFRPDSTE